MYDILYPHLSYNNFDKSHFISSLMMELARHEGWHLELCRHNRAVLETPTIRDDSEKRHIALSRAVLYLVLAPHEPEQADLTHRLLADKLLDEIPIYK